MRFRKPKTAPPLFTRVTAAAGHTADGGFRLAAQPQSFEEGLYEALRANVPVIDAAITKLVRLTGGFRFECENKDTEEELERFFKEIPVSVSGSSLDTFSEMYLDSLLTYGRAVGEILISERTYGMAGLSCADCTQYSVIQSPSDGSLRVYGAVTGEEIKCRHPERLLYTVSNPSAKHPSGTSLLRGLPSLSSILMRVYETVGQNFDRAGNVRYAVTYKPLGENDAAFAAERAAEIAKQWADGMQSSKAGAIKDFVAVGDVDIKIIGADGLILDTEVPVRQLLEQLVAKLSIPPFLLGLSWSTTERMSSQQADILTSEIDYYRRLLGQMIMKVVRLYCALEGIDERVALRWDNVNLQDEEALARARLYNAQAEKAELENAALKANAPHERRN